MEEIRTNYQGYNQKKPDKITRDSRGTEFYVGARVAYNRSGDVIIGTLLRIVKNEWVKGHSSENDYARWFLKFEAHTEGEDGKISKLKNPNGLVII